MASLEELRKRLDAHEQSQDFDGLRAVREEILASYPDTDDAVEAQYKLGLDALFRRRELDVAVALFAGAAKRKHAFWSQAARTSLGLCYQHQGQSQKALFELRRVGFTDEPNMHSITALSFIENILMLAGNVEEAKRARAERIKQLLGLVEGPKAVSAKKDLGFYLYHLGIAELDAKNEKAARKYLTRAKDLGPSVVGAELYRQIATALGR